MPLKYVLNSAVTIVRVFAICRPFRFFFLVGTSIFGCGILLGFRYLYLKYDGQGPGHTQSLILSAVFLITGVQTYFAAIFADLISINRKLIEEKCFEERRAKFNLDSIQVEMVKIQNKSGVKE